LYAVSHRVRDLSRGLTGDRSLAGERYLSNPDLLGAYLLHYWPISYAQATLCLAMMLRAPEPPALGRVLDVGAGPGPVSLALLDAGAGRVISCDRSAAALSMARSIATERGYTLEPRQWDALTGTGMPSGPFDVISLGHTLNELWAGHPDRIALRVSLLVKLCAELAPSGRLLFFEPALMATAQEAIRVRDGLLKEGVSVEMPCIWRGSCPALPDATCHGDFEWSPPRETVRLMHAARIGRETLKMAWFVMRKGAGGTGEPAVAPAPATLSAPVPAAPPRSQSASPAPDGGLYRVVSDPLLSKSGRIRYLICGPMGRFALSAPKAMQSPDMKPFFRLRRGDVVRFTGAKRRETGWGLDDTGTVQIIERLPRMG
jgi:SAM-dependent methyltransferase